MKNSDNLEFKSKSIKINSIQNLLLYLGISFGDKQKEILYNDLGTLLQSGIDLKSSFDLIVKDFDTQHALFINKLQQQIIQGTSLSLAMELSGLFTPYEYHTIQIGEEIGQLDKVLLDLGGYYKKRVSQKRQLLQALTYPIVVLFTSLMAIFFMLNFIVPMFADIFSRSGNELPSLTVLILKLSSWSKKYLPGLMLLLTIVIIFGVYKKKHPWNRKWYSFIVSKIPLLGDTIEKIYLARFCNAMALLTTAQVPLNRALILCKKMVSYYPIEESLIHIQKQVVLGHSLFESLKEHKIYDSRLLSLIRIGEETNQLPLFFGKLASQYEDVIAYRSESMSSILEPLLILGLGLFVGFILIAMYLPMFQIGSTLQ